MTLKKPLFSQTLAILAACLLSTMLCLAQEVSNGESSKRNSHVQVIFIDTLSSSSPSKNAQLDSNICESVENICSFGVDTRGDEYINVTLKYFNQSEDTWYIIPYDHVSSLLRDYTGFELNDLYTRLLNLSDLQSLTLEIRDQYHSQTGRWLNTFGRCPPVRMSYLHIPPLQNLNEIIVLTGWGLFFMPKDLWSSPYAPSGWLSSFTSNLRQLPNLTSLHIEFWTWIRGVSNEEVIQFSETLPTLKNLTTVKLLSLHFEITDLGLTSLFKGLSEVAKLKSLTLLFDMTNVSPVSFTNSLELISRISSLEFLSLSLTALSSDLLLQFSHVLPTFTSIRSLELIFRDWNVQERAIKQLARSISTLTSLTSLVLNFPSEKTTLTGIGYLLESAYNLPNIMALEFYAGYSHITVNADISIPSKINQLAISYQ